MLLSLPRGVFSRLTWFLDDRSLRALCCCSQWINTRCCCLSSPYAGGGGGGGGAAYCYGWKRRLSDSVPSVQFLRGWGIDVHRNQGIFEWMLRQCRCSKEFPPNFSHERFHAIVFVMKKQVCRVRRIMQALQCPRRKVLTYREYNGLLRPLRDCQSFDSFRRIVGRIDLHYETDGGEHFSIQSYDGLQTMSLQFGADYVSQSKALRGTVTIAKCPAGISSIIDRSLPLEIIPNDDVLRQQARLAEHIFRYGYGGANGRLYLGVYAADQVRRRLLQQEVNKERTSAYLQLLRRHESARANNNANTTSLHMVRSDIDLLMDLATYLYLRICVHLPPAPL